MLSCFNVVSDDMLLYARRRCILCILTNVHLHHDPDYLDGMWTTLFNMQLHHIPYKSKKYPQHRLSAHSRNHTSTSSPPLLLLKPLQLLPLHLLLDPQPRRHHRLPRPLDLPPWQPLRLPPQHPQRRPLHQTILPLPLPSIKAHRLAQAHGRVRNHAKVALGVVRRAVQHQRVQQEHVARVAAGLDIVGVGALRCHVVEPVQVLVVDALGGCEGATGVGVAGRHVRGDAVRVGVEVLRDGAHAGRVEHGAAALWRDVGEERDDEEALLGRVEVVDELGEECER